MRRRTHEAPSRRMCVSSDAGVSVSSRCLDGKQVLLAVSGGIAAVESVKLSRELRRHGASVVSMMTRSAEKVISPLALSWGSGSDVLTEWDSEMAQLGRFDGVLLAPATRNTIAKHVHGVMDSPLMMALSAARGSKTPLMFVPSMHDDLFDDPVTEELIDSLEFTGAFVLLEDPIESRRKQPSAPAIVANFSNIINKNLPGRKRIAITLGANRAQIDAVRAIQNTSSGQTGWAIAEHLYRMGHEVICIVGETSVQPSFHLPDLRFDSTPDGMLSLCIELASSEIAPEAWIHAAAVLDYIPRIEEGKKSSGEGQWDLSLFPVSKHIEELSELVKGMIRIGFKLEVDTSEDDLIESANKQISTYGLDAVIANFMDEVRNNTSPRCRIVMPGGKANVLQDRLEMCEAIEAIISAN